MCCVCPTTAYLDGVTIDWDKTMTGQTKICHQSMKPLTNELDHVNRCRLTGWSPRDYRNQWLGILNEVAQNRLQWRSCIRFFLPKLWDSKFLITLFDVYPTKLYFLKLYFRCLICPIITDTVTISTIWPTILMTGYVKLNRCS